MKTVDHKYCARLSVFTPGEAEDMYDDYAMILRALESGEKRFVVEVAVRSYFTDPAEPGSRTLYRGTSVSDTRISSAGDGMIEMAETSVKDLLSGKYPESSNKEDMARLNRLSASGSCVIASLSAYEHPETLDDPPHFEWVAEAMPGESVAQLAKRLVNTAKKHDCGCP